jgi:hypothetical protein
VMSSPGDQTLALNDNSSGALWHIVGSYQAELTVPVGTKIAPAGGTEVVAFERIFQHVDGGGVVTFAGGETVILPAGWTVLIDCPVATDRS